MRVYVLSINGKKEEYDVDEDMPISSIDVQSDESLLYNGKRLVLECQNCHGFLTFGDIAKGEKEIKLYRILNAGGPKVEHYIFPSVYGSQLIATHKMCNVCQTGQTGQKNTQNIAQFNKSGTLDIIIDTKYSKNSYNIGPFSDAISVTGATIKNVLILIPYYHLELDISKCKINDIITFAVDTQIPRLTNGLNFDTRSVPIIEYRIKLVPDYWTTSTSKIFFRDSQIRKELLALQSVHKFPKDIILYIGRFL